MLSLLAVFACWVGITFSALDVNKLNQVEGHFKEERDKILTKNKVLKLNKNKDIITSFKPTKYVINIEEPVEDRLGALCTEYAGAVVAMYNYFNYVLNLFGLADEFYGFVTNWYHLAVPEPYKEEIAFYAECTGIPLAGSITLNLMELFLVLGCTSIIGVDEDDIIYHGRDLDTGLGAVQGIAESMMVTLEYKKNGETLFETTAPFGFSGVIQGVKPSQFSISANLRYSTTLPQNINAMGQGYYPFAWLIRDTFTNAANYQDALTLLKTTPIIAPVYLSIAGLSYPDGAVITRDYTAIAHLNTLDDTDLGWFIAVTNHDWWNEVVILDSDAFSAERRDAAIENMNILTRSDLNAYSMFTVMSQVPNVNFGTLTTSVFSASGHQKKMHNTMVVRLSMPDDAESRLFLYPSNSNWMPVFVVILLVSVSLNMVMCIKRFICSKSKTKYYLKVSQEMMKEVDSDLDDGTDDEQI